MPTIRQVWQLTKQGDNAFPIDLKDVYIFLLLSITIIFLHFVRQLKPYQWKVLTFGFATTPRAFTSLTKPILFLCECNSFCFIIHLHDIMVLTHAKHATERAQTF